MERLATMAKVSPEGLQRGAKMSQASCRAPTTTGDATGNVAIERSIADACCCKHPEYLGKLDDHRRARLIGMSDSLLGRVVRYLAERPDADLASLLGYWAGQEGHETLRGTRRSAVGLG